MVTEDPDGVKGPETGSQVPSRWPGDRVPSEDGYGGVNGDCPACGDKLMWTGWGWSAHGMDYHRATERRLLRAARALMDREADLKQWRARNAAGGLVGIRWQCGVYPGWQSERRTTLHGWMWDAMTDHRKDLWLKGVRGALTRALERHYDVVVNQATWFHKVYDDRTASGCDSRPAPLS